MPIYEYRCSACGHQAEVLQKFSDPALTTCTACGKPSFTKLLSAAGFQLKGSGWYATDFKASAKKVEAKTEAKPEAKDPKPESKPETKSDTKGETKTESKAAA